MTDVRQPSEIELLDAYVEWLDDPAPVDEARLALEFKAGIDDTRLTHWTHAMIDELVQSYIPAKLVLVDVEAADVVDSLALFLDFLAETGRISTDSDPVDDLVAHAESHIDDMQAAMNDPSVGGPAKEIIRALLDDGVDITDDDAVSSWIEDFNVGQRSFDPTPPELPPTTRMTPEVAAQSAEVAPLFAKLTYLAEYMGDGRPLTGAGNLKLADARHLVEALETEDEFDPVIGDRTFKTHTAAILNWLDMIVWIARTVRAVKVRNNQMSVTKKWLARAAKDPLEVMSEVAVLLLDQGPLGALFGDDLDNEMRSGVEASLVGLLASLTQTDVEYEGYVESILSEIPRRVYVPEFYYHQTRGGDTFLARTLRLDAQKAVTILEMAGLMTWTGGETEPDEYGISEVKRGGMLSLTAFGHWIVQGPLVESEQVRMAVVEPLTVTLDDAPEEIVVALSGYVEAGPDALTGAWDELGGWDGLLEQLWRVERPETKGLLEALGNDLSDKASAKAARKALLKHRSWIANRR